MGIVVKNIDDIYEPLTEEQKNELEKADKMPISFDDCPELTDEQLSQFVRVSKPFSIGELKKLKDVSNQH